MTVIGVVFLSWNLIRFTVNLKVAPCFYLLRDRESVHGYSTQRWRNGREWFLLIPRGATSHHINLKLLEWMWFPLFLFLFWFLLLLSLSPTCSCQDLRNRGIWLEVDSIQLVAEIRGSLGGRWMRFYNYPPSPKPISRIQAQWSTAPLSLPPQLSLLYFFHSNKFFCDFNSLARNFGGSGPWGTNYVVFALGKAGD